MSCDNYDCVYESIKSSGYIHDLTKRVTELQEDSTKQLLELRELRKWRELATVYMGQVVSSRPDMLKLRRELLGIDMEVVK